MTDTTEPCRDALRLLVTSTRTNLFEAAKRTLEMHPDARFLIWHNGSCEEFAVCVHATKLLDARGALMALDLDEIDELDDIWAEKPFWLESVLAAYLGDDDDRLDLRAVVASLGDRAEV